MQKLNILSVLIASTLWCGSLNSAANEDSDVPFAGISFSKVTVVLTATENAPGATGKASLKFENEQGMISGTLEVETRGLSGPFVTSVVKASDGAVVVLSQSTGADESQDAAELEAGIALPADLDSNDLAQIVIASPEGLPLLVADLRNPDTQISMRFQSLVSVTAGPAASAVQGKALLQLSARDGKSVSRFDLIAQKLSPATRYTIQVDGEPIGMITSTKNGVIQMRRLFNVDLFTVHRVELFDETGSLALAVQF